MKLDQSQVQHLLLRGGFGDNYTTVRRYVGATPEEILEDQWKKTRRRSRIPVNQEINLIQFRQASQQDKKRMLEQGRESVKALNDQWVKHMANAASAFTEKMAFFWHDHFACKSVFGGFMESYLEIIRKHALGNFRDLLFEVSQSAAMLQFLNNQQNRKQAPNENFAREVMELFTLGRDQGYTEQDISEAARAFTGWGFDRSGQFVKRSYFHDRGQKTVFGRSGNFDGEDILNMLLENPQTARYISQKWVRFFLHSEGHEALEHEVAEVFYQSGYDIKAALQVLFTSEVFYDRKYLGCRIKSPIELIVGIQRQLRVRLEDRNSVLFLQNMLGQVLLNPPTVAGWTDGKNWVDSSSLLFRMNLPELIFRAAYIQNLPESSFDDNDVFSFREKLRQLNAQLDLEALVQELDRESLGPFLIQGYQNDEQMPSNWLDALIHITSKPEYQLC
jgi:uncharacterized protein (DUF1800 family)